MQKKKVKEQDLEKVLRYAASKPVSLGANNKGTRLKSKHLQGVGWKK